MEELTNKSLYFEEYDTELLKELVKIPDNFYSNQYTLNWDSCGDEDLPEMPIYPLIQRDNIGEFEIDPNIESEFTGLSDDELKELLG